MKVLFRIAWVVPLVGWACFFSGAGLGVCPPALAEKPVRSDKDWPLVRGDALASGVAPTALPAKLELLWKYSLEDSGFAATAVIADGKVFVGDVDGTFHTLALADGELLWKRSFADSGFTEAAAVVAGRIVVGDFDGVVRCLDARKGKEIWSYGKEIEQPDVANKQEPELPIVEQAAQLPEEVSESYAAPNIHQGMVLITTDGGQLLALDLMTGKRKWEYRIEAPLRCWPTVIEGQVLLAGCDQRLQAVDIATGKASVGIDIDAQTGSTPAVMAGDVFFGTEQGTFYSIAAKTMEVQWEYRDPKRGQAIRCSAAVEQRCVVFSNHGKHVTALNPTDGEPLWIFTVRGRLESSPVIAGDRVFLPTKRGRLYAVDIKTGEKKWEYEAGGNFTASPAVADGKLVIGNENGTLYCFGKKE